MLQEIKFNLNKFDSDNNELNDLTNNTIILCQNSDIKYTISVEIKKALNNPNYEYADFYYDDNDKYSIEIQHKPTTILNVYNEDTSKAQNIIITTEVPFVLQCKTKEDLWFAKSDNFNEINLYAFTDFVGNKDDWDKGVAYLYKCVLNGIFGDFAYGS